MGTDFYEPSCLVLDCLELTTEGILEETIEEEELLTDGWLYLSS